MKWIVLHIAETYHFLKVDETIKMGLIALMCKCHICLKIREKKGLIVFKYLNFFIMDNNHFQDIMLNM